MALATCFFILENTRFFGRDGEVYTAGVDKLKANPLLSSEWAKQMFALITGLGIKK